MKQQILNFIVQTLGTMNVTASEIDEEADVIFDLNLNVGHIDFLFSLLEKHYHLNTPLMFSKEVATLSGLADYVGNRVA